MIENLINGSVLIPKEVFSPTDMEEKSERPLLSFMRPCRPLILPPDPLRLAKSFPTNLLKSFLIEAVT